MTQVAEQLYEALEPLARATGDADAGAPLRALCDALAPLLQIVVDLSEDTDDGPGWSIIMDVDRAPAYALPWLAQTVGVRLLAGTTEDEQRDRIRATDGFKRGTPAAMVAAAQRTLTGNRSVVFRERDGGAYKLTVVTRTSETPDSAATLAALLEQKPAGIVLTYLVHDGQDYQQIYDNFATYELVFTTYATYQDVLDDTP